MQEKLLSLIVAKRNANSTFSEIYSFICQVGKDQKREMIESQ